MNTVADSHVVIIAEQLCCDKQLSCRQAMAAYANGGMIRCNLLQSVWDDPGFHKIKSGRH